MTPETKSKSSISYRMLLSLIFSVCLILGYHTKHQGFYEITNIYGSWGVVIGAVICFLAVYIILWLLFAVMEKSGLLYSSESEITSSRAAALLFKHPFLIPFLVLLIAYLPYMIFSYPANIMADTKTMLTQGMGLTHVTTHHPLAYEMALTLFVKFGVKVFGSYNIGIFIFAVGQSLLAIIVISAGIGILIKEVKLRWGFTVALMIYYIVSPMVSTYMFLITKDTWYGAFILLFGECLFLALEQGWSNKTTALTALASFGVMISRNDGIYVVLITFLVVLLVKREWRIRMLVFLAGVFLVNFCIGHVIIPVLGIESGSKREMLSIPVQQTARTVLCERDTITTEEEKAILNAFEFESLDEMAEAYMPERSDKIKNVFVYDIFCDAAVQYYKTWLKMGFKHPRAYAEAYLANYYQYFYPGTQLMCYSYQSSIDRMVQTNERVGTDFHYPEKNSDVKFKYEKVRNGIFGIFPFSGMNDSGVITWALLIWFFWLLYKKKYDKLILTLPMIIITLICFASPCNGYYGRYQYPMVIYIPWALLATLKTKKRS